MNENDWLKAQWLKAQYGDTGVRKGGATRGAAPRHPPLAERIYAEIMAKVVWWGIKEDEAGAMMRFYRDVARRAAEVWEDKG